MFERDWIYVLEEKMAAETESSPTFVSIEGGYGKDNGLSMDDENSKTMESLKQIRVGKPPRHLSVLRHCVSTARLEAGTELVSC